MSGDPAPETVFIIEPTGRGVERTAVPLDMLRPDDRARCHETPESARQAAADCKYVADRFLSAIDPRYTEVEYAVREVTL